jgi:hypothetical protein
MKLTSSNKWQNQSNSYYNSTKEQRKKWIFVNSINLTKYFGSCFLTRKMIHNNNDFLTNLVLFITNGCVPLFMSNNPWFWCMYHNYYVIQRWTFRR